jgi:uncharacterized OB-fold protein
MLPAIDADAAPFFEGCREGVLRMQQCAETGRLIFPPRPMSPWAPHATPVWTAVSGRGTIWSFAVPHPPLLPEAFGGEGAHIIDAVEIRRQLCLSVY